MLLCRLALSLLLGEEGCVDGDVERIRHEELLPLLGNQLLLILSTERVEALIPLAPSLSQVKPPPLVRHDRVVDGGSELRSLELLALPRGELMAGLPEVLLDDPESDGLRLDDFLELLSVELHGSF